MDSKDNSKGDVEAKETGVAAVVVAAVDASSILPSRLWFVTNRDKAK
jgi:hypothetical protein